MTTMRTRNLCWMIVVVALQLPAAALGWINHASSRSAAVPLRSQPVERIRNSPAGRGTRTVVHSTSSTSSSSERAATTAAVVDTKGEDQDDAALEDFFQMIPTPPGGEQEAIDKHKRVWLLPPLLSLASGIFYADTNRIFHNLLNAVCGDAWRLEGGGLDEIKEVINGPVALSVSILLGTLVAMTIQTLYDNKTNTFRVLIASIEEMREFNLVLQSFPEPYRTKCRTLLNRKYDKCGTMFSLGVLEAESLRQNSRDMAELRFILQELSHDKEHRPEYIGEAFSCLNNMKDLRSQMLASLQTTFSAGHYGNIVILATSLLLVFLLETDVGDASTQQSLQIPLSVCWALLVGTFSMLFAVIYDLRYRSVMAIQDTLERTGQSFDDMREYATASRDTTASIMNGSGDSSSYL